MHRSSCIVLMVLTPLVIATSLRPLPVCDEKKNEVSTHCLNTCENTCPGKDKPNPCPRIACKPGCACAKGYLRRDSTENCPCIPVKDCPPTGPVCDKKKNEVFTKCLNTCEDTCPGKGKRDPCPRIACKPGCTCADGYKRRDSTANSPCVPVKDCPPTGPVCDKKKNEVFTKCLNTCEDTCPAKGGPKPCPLIACKPGCTCADGYKRRDSTANSPCVPVKDCPPTGPVCDKKKNEVPTDCLDKCGNTCPGKDKPNPCPRIACKPGCTCADGYKRRDSTENSPCVPVKDCPPIVPICDKNKHEVATDCVNTCGNTCDTVGKKLYCPLKVCKAGCACAEGYVRRDGTKDSPCIPTKCCPANDPVDPTKPAGCGVNTVCVPPCVDFCPPSCTVPKPEACPKICLKDGCVCKKGYIRSTNRTSSCIPDSCCPYIIKH